MPDCETRPETTRPPPTFISERTLKSVFCRTTGRGGRGSRLTSFRSRSRPLSLRESRDDIRGDSGGVVGCTGAASGAGSASESVGLFTLGGALAGAATNTGVAGCGASDSRRLARKTPLRRVEMRATCAACE